MYSVLYKYICFNFWFLVGGIIWKCCRILKKGSFVEGGELGEWILRIYSLVFIY